MTTGASPGEAFDAFEAARLGECHRCLRGVLSVRSPTGSSLPFSTPPVSPPALDCSTSPADPATSPPKPQPVAPNRSASMWPAFFHFADDDELVTLLTGNRFEQTTVQTRGDDTTDSGSAELFEGNESFDFDGDLGFGNTVDVTLVSNQLTVERCDRQRGNTLRAKPARKRAFPHNHNTNEQGPSPRK